VYCVYGFQDGEEPQKERDTFISPDAEEAIAGEGSISILNGNLL
jgi:hypothetical protein